MSIGPVGSTSSYSGRLRSVNLRPLAPSTGTGSEGSSSSSGSSDSASARPSVSEEQQNGSTSRGSQSGLGPPSSSQRRLGLIDGSGSSESSNGSSDPESGSQSDAAASDGESDVGPERSDELSPAERRQVQELKRIDAKVRAHEQAHLAAAGQYAQGGISFETKTGPDGEEYAVAGQVSLDTSRADTPRETIQKMRQVKSAALAPAQPSPQDRSIATQASRRLSEARRKLQSQDASQGSGSESAGPSNGEAGESRESPGFERPGDFGSSAADTSNTNQGVAATGSTTERQATNGSLEQYRNEGATAASNRRGQALNLLA